MVRSVDQIGAIHVDQLPGRGKSVEVVARVRGMIRDGTLVAGDALPSTRALAAELGVARGTVVAAYEQLDGEGWIRTRQGAAARVEAGVPSSGDGAAAHGAAAHGAAGRGAAARRAAGRGRAGRPGTDQAGDAAAASASAVLDCRPGIPAVTAIAPKDWRAAWRAAADAPLRNALSDPLGLPELRAQVAAQLGLGRGFAPDVERVVVTAGTAEALSLVVEGLRNHLGRAPRIAVEDPGYRSGRRSMTSAGADLVGIAVDGDGMDLDLLAAAPRVDAVVVTPTHQYPLGSVMPVARRHALLEWAARTRTVVIEDDYDSEFRHRGAPVPALAALDGAGVVVHVGGFSKTLDPRIRCSYVVLPSHGTRSDVASAVVAARRARGPVVAEQVQVALTHLLRSGALRRHLGRVRRDYTHRRERIAARLRGAAGLEARALNGGLHAVVTWSGPPTARAVVARSARDGVLVSALEEYEVEPGSAPPGVVLGYGALTLPQLDRALDVLSDALASLSRR